MLAVPGCAKLTREESSTVVSPESQQTDHWIIVPNNDEEETFPFPVGSARFPIARRLPLGGADTRGIGDSNLVVLGETTLASKVYVVAQYGTGSGVFNPIICIYEKESSMARLRFVWSRPLFSIYGFNEYEFTEKTLRLVANYPAAHGAEAYYSESSLPAPEGVLPEK
jgi:hypothetical protein